MVKRYCGESAKTVTAKNKGTLLMSKSMKILIVDDDTALLATSKLMFSSLGHKPITASDADQALDILKEDKEIDFIFTDLGLPKIDGWELIHRARVEGFDKPIAVVSGVSDYVNKELMEDLKVFRNISKPFKLSDLSDLLQSVEEIIGED